MMTFYQRAYEQRRLPTKQYDEYNLQHYHTVRHAQLPSGSNNSGAWSY